MVVFCLMALLTPFITALAIHEGLKEESRQLLGRGPGIYVTEDRFGSNAPISLAWAPVLAALPGVDRVIPRVIGRTYLNHYFIAVLGASPEFLPPSLSIAQGRRHGESGEVLLGEGLARLAGLKPGGRFRLARSPEQLFRVSGLFRSSYTIWNTDLLIMSLNDAARLYGQPGLATDLVLETRPGYEEPLAEKILALGETRPQSPPLRVQTKSLVQSYVLRGFDVKAGVFAGLYSLALFLAIPILLVTTGLGLAGRRKEIGIVKALGWQTQEVLILIGWENLFLALASLPGILLTSQLWLRALNGALLNRFFVANWDILPPFPLPSETFPIPFLLTFLLGIILTLVGSLYSTWRIAVAPPHEALHG